jgi:hypothetical protein
MRFQTSPLETSDAFGDPPFEFLGNSAVSHVCVWSQSLLMHRFVEIVRKGGSSGVWSGMDHEIKMKAAS